MPSPPRYTWRIACEPVMVGGVYPAPPPEANRQFFARYRELYGRAAPTIASHGYDALALAAILARSGDIVLIAPDLQTGPQALLEAPNGATVLAAGQKVDITGRGLEGIRLQMQAPSDQAVNLGTLKGDAVGVFAATLKHSGLIQANAVSTEGGKVVLKANADAQTTRASSLRE